MNSFFGPLNVDKVINYLFVLESSFGQIINSTTFMSLVENSIITKDTTLYCVAEDKTSPQIIWTYTNSSGTSSNITATSNDATTGISTLYVYSNKPGYYSCEVITEVGTVKMHTVKVLDTALYTGKLSLN